MKRRTIDGSTSRFIILALALVSVTVCAVQGTIDGDVYSAVLATIIGGIVHASGTKPGVAGDRGPAARRVGRYY